MSAFAKSIFTTTGQTSLSAPLCNSTVFLSWVDKNPFMKQLLGIFALCAVCATAFSQKIISGKITDVKNGEPLPGVSITVKDTALGTVTDLEGNFSFQTPASGLLLISFIGYDQQKFEISGITAPLHVEMRQTEVGLEQVVISGSKREEKILESPSAISVINATQIRNNVTINLFKNLESTPGVDIIPTGLVSGNVVTHGFNGVFSEMLFTAVDNRIGSVPSLRVNALQLIPTNNEDIERIEVVKGPASALYGPNAASGVMHIITKSPLDMKERFKTKASFAYGIESDDSRNWGNRDVYSANLWHGGKINKKVGYKISANYFNGDDWPYDDPAEPDSVFIIRQTIEGNDTLEGPVDNSRDNNIESYSIDTRVDYRIKPDMELIFSGGYRNGSNVEMTGLGASQVINWKYMYAQSRFLWKSLFAQVYVNFSNSGDTYLLRSGNRVIDKSKFICAQIQHSYKPIKQIRFTYGFDALLTRPNTDRTLYGKFEDNDNINELGLYLQGDFDVHKKISIVGAVRADYHNFVDGIFWSPRAAFVYKPNAKNTLRATYNRAFNSPGSTNLSLDVIQGYIPYVDIPIMAEGNREGFNYQYANNPFITENPLLPQYLSPLGTNPSAYNNLNDPNMNNFAWEKVKSVVEEQFVLAGLPRALADTLVKTIAPADISNVLNVVKSLNLTTFSFEKTVDPATIQNLNSLENAITQSYEIGYKGMLFDRLMLTVDAYRMDKKNFISDIQLISPSVFLDSVTLTQNISDAVTRAIYGADPNDPADDIKIGFITPETLVALLDQNPELGNSNGRADDEFIRIFSTAGAQLPFGSITPTENAGGEMILSYTNIGNLTVYGIDVGATFFVTEDMRINAAYSWMSEDTIHDDLAQFGYIALNAPQNKVALGFSYDIKKIGLETGLRWRWQQGFQANSGVYVGPVDAYNTLDLNLTYKLWFSKKTEVTLSMQNLIGERYQPFPGAPELGRLTMLRLSHEF